MKNEKLKINMNTVNLEPSTLAARSHGQSRTVRRGSRPISTLETIFDKLDHSIRLQNLKINQIGSF